MLHSRSIHASPSTASGLPADAHGAAGRHPRQRVVERRVAGLGALLAQAPLALEHDRLGRGQDEVDGGLGFRGAQAHGERLRALALDGPVVDPDAKGPGGGPGQAEGRAPAAAPCPEAAPAGVGHRKMREVHLARPPRRLAPRWVGGEGGPEECQLEAEMASASRLEIPRVVPPLRPEAGVRAMVVGKGERARRLSAGVAREVAAAEGLGHRERALHAVVAAPVAGREPGRREGRRHRQRGDREGGRPSTRHGAPPPATRAPWCAPGRGRRGARPSPPGGAPARGRRGPPRAAWSSRTIAGSRRR